MLCSPIIQLLCASVFSAIKKWEMTTSIGLSCVSWDLGAHLEMYYLVASLLTKRMNQWINGLTFLLSLISQMNPTATRRKNLESPAARCWVPEQKGQAWSYKSTGSYRRQKPKTLSARNYSPTKLQKDMFFQCSLSSYPRMWRNMWKKKTESFFNKVREVYQIFQISKVSAAH